MARQELAVHDHGPELEPHAPAVRHPFARVVRHIDEDPLDPLGVHIDLEAIRGLRQHSVMSSPSTRFSTGAMSRSSRGTLTGSTLPICWCP